MAMQAARARVRQLELDSQIHHLRAEIAILSQERNTLSRSHLPPEILTLVLLRASEGAWSEDLGSVNLVSVWTTLTHTCHQWRKIALATAPIWATVVFNRSCSQWASVALQ